MHFIERGQGEPLVLIPGLQGRWEYMRPAVSALAEFYRVITFPLCDERSARAPFDPDRGVDNFADQVCSVLDRAHVRSAVICGVSFGGVVALRCAARHAERTKALILVSTPGPTWHLRRKHELYSRLPWLFGPLFVAESPWRLRREIAVAIPNPRERRAFVVEQLKTLCRAPLSLPAMAARARMIKSSERAAECASVTAPTLVIHGEPSLDHVVHTAGTCEYATLIPGARVAMMSGTGHLGSITRPREFARVIRDFLVSLPAERSDSAA